MGIKASIEKGNKYYFYTTTEDLTVCPKCKNEYKARKKCLNCKTETVITTKVHKGSITLNLKKYKCDCIFSSFFRFAGHWLNNHPRSSCKHVKNAIREIKHENKIAE